MIVKNVCDYNREMAKLYKKSAMAFLIAGVGFILLPVLGVTMLCFNCTVGIYLVYGKYRKILKLYS